MRSTFASAAAAIGVVAISCHSGPTPTAVPGGQNSSDTDVSIPSSCDTLGMRSSPPKSLSDIRIDTVGWTRYSGRYRLFMFASDSVPRSFQLHERRLDLVFASSLPPPEFEYASQVAGQGLLFGDLQSLSFADLKAPGDQGEGLGYSFLLRRQSKFGSVGWGVGSLGTESGIVFRIAKLEPGRIKGWWYDASTPAHGGPYGKFCAVLAAPAP